MYCYRHFTTGEPTAGTVLVRITEDSKRQLRISSTTLARLTKEGSRKTSPFALDSLIFSEVKAFETAFNHSAVLLALIIKMTHQVLFQLAVSLFLALKDKYRKAMIITLALPLLDDPQTIFISHCKQLGNPK